MQKIILASLMSGLLWAPAALAHTFTGNAHWYGGHFHGRRTASGAVFDKNRLTAAHPSLPFGSRVRVKSLYTGKDVVVEVNDRCPRLSQRCIDLSEGAARKLGIYPGAPSHVECEVLGKTRKLASVRNTAD
jgi:rare lipoprotein A